MPSSPSDEGWGEVIGLFLERAKSSRLYGKLVVEVVDGKVARCVLEKSAKTPDDFRASVLDELDRDVAPGPKRSVG